MLLTKEGSLSLSKSNDCALSDIKYLNSWVHNDNINEDDNDKINKLVDLFKMVKNNSLFCKMVIKESSLSCLSMKMFT